MNVESINKVSQTKSMKDWEKSDIENCNWEYERCCKNVKISNGLI